MAPRLSSATLARFLLWVLPMPTGAPQDCEPHEAGTNAPRPATSPDDAFAPFTGSHHARYLPPDIPFHIISSTFQRRHLLRPCKALNSIILGVLGRAQTRFP